MPATRTRGRADRSPSAAKPRSDVYTGLLVISFVAMLAGTVLLYLDLSKYPEQKPPAPPQRTPAAAQNPAGGAAPAPAPAPQGGGAPAPAPQGGGNPAAPAGGGGNPMPPGGGGNPRPPGGL